MPPATVQNPQVLEAAVSGPNGANRLFTCTGIATFFLQVSAGAQTQTFTFLVGPTLTRPQFHRATGTASISGVQSSTPGTQASSYQWQVNSVEVDWDDESGEIEVRLEINATSSASMSLALQRLTYYVAMLAEL